MNIIRKTMALVLAAGLVVFSGCTAKYQDMLRDRDETIRGLESKLQMTRRDFEKLRSDLAKAQGDLAAARAGSPKVQPAGFDKKTSSLDELQQALAKEGISDRDVKARYRHGRISIGIANRVTFASGSTRLSAEGTAILQRLAKVLHAQYGDKKIYVEGHTDSDPIRKTRAKYRSNRHLSAERADAVASFLTKKGGLPESRVVIVGFGPYDPVSKADKAQNRRVEIVVADAP